jgi:hypothetical protein
MAQCSQAVGAVDSLDHVVSGFFQRQAEAFAPGFLVINQ